jgi:hypothetical protein
MAGGKVSSGKPKSGPPAHANRSAFRHNPSSRLTKHILALPINDLCPACEEQIEWRKRFRKYKPLTVPKRCVKCQEKSAIKEAYHVICRACCRKENKCAKCLEPRSLDVKKAEIRGEKESKPAATFIKKPDSEEEEEEEEESENEEDSEDFDDEEDSDDDASDLASAVEGIELENSSNDESDEFCPQCEADLDVCVCEYDSEDADEDDEDDYDGEYDEDFDDDFDEDCLDEVDEDDDFDDDDELDDTDDEDDDEDELSH